MWLQRLLYKGRTCPFFTYIGDYRAEDKNTMATLQSEASGVNEQGLQVVALPLECGVRMRRNEPRWRNSR